MKMSTDLKKQEFAARLQQATRHAGLDKYGMFSEFARRFGVTPRAVQKWFEGESIPRDIDPLASFLGVRSDWLRSGQGSMSEVTASAADGAEINVALHAVPEISASQYDAWIAGELDKSELNTFVATGPLPSTAFCLQVKDNSLGDRVLRGMRVVVNPEREPGSSDLAVAYLNDSFVFGYPTKRGRWFMDPPNSSFPAIDLGENPLIAGTLVQIIGQSLTTS